MSLLSFGITQKEKAVYAFLVGAIGSYMTQNGLSWHQVLTVAGLKAAFVGIVSHQFVYWVENSKAPVDLTEGAVPATFAPAPQDPTPSA